MDDNIWEYPFGELDDDYEDEYPYRKPSGRDINLPARWAAGKSIRYCGLETERIRHCCFNFNTQGLGLARSQVALRVRLSG